MQPVQKPITGQENPTDLSMPEQALSQFYHAFNSRDMEMMAQNWAQADDIVMDNPLGGIKRGWSEIQPVYARILEGPAQVYVEYYDYTLHETGEVFYTGGRERGYLRSGSVDLTLAIRTSRLFRRIDSCWRQVHHHGSIEDPQLLAKYQAVVLGRESKRRHEP
jgi:hypothetical protein